MSVISCTQRSSGAQWVFGGRQVDANNDARVGFDEFVRVMAPLLQDGVTSSQSAAVPPEDARALGMQEALTAWCWVNLDKMSCCVVNKTGELGAACKYKGVTEIQAGLPLCTRNGWCR